MGLAAYISVLLGDLTEKRAENLVAGDSLREAMTGQAAPIQKTMNSPAVGMYRIAADNGCILDVTEDHAILTRSGMKDAGRVVVGEELHTAAGLVRCTEATRLMGDYMVYDITVATPTDAAPCLIANGLVVSAQKAR